ncbi:DUF4232 domain-containing protein [Nocardioides sp. YIM 152315]|uniref:DUF4232 domain-containing protein n=1 Tax=Nocardioides sp. YIM 152315 TaxID=3031760 RepID=UPI0023DA3651|nr:DUF4232 domain-containing protein [Nocardioides sp. YIM 152315]MDF1606020.1 DUF4232 domain-containing protein [Nocardioides sp. YIM 152315]
MTKRLIASLVLGLLAAGLTILTAHAAGPPECTNAHLKASYRGGDAGMSHRYGWIVLRNVSDRACRIEGYGGLSYVGGGDGTQVGAAATRAKGRTPSTVVRPGHRVSSPVAETLAAPYPKRRCRPAHVDGLRVYLPDETRSQFVRHPGTGCRNERVHLLEHGPYRARR